MKKILAFTLILCMLFNMASFAIPVLDGAEAAELDAVAGLEGDRRHLLAVDEGSVGGAEILQSPHALFAAQKRVQGGNVAVLQRQLALPGVAPDFHALLRKGVRFRLVVYGYRQFCFHVVFLG